MRGETAIAGTFDGLGRSLDPDSFAERQVPTVELAIDLKRLTEPRWSTGYIEKLVGSTAALHQLQPFERLDGPEQHGAGSPVWFGHYVHAEPGMNRVNVQQPGFTEHRRVLAVRPPVGMRCRIVAGQIGLGFDDPTRAPPCRRIAHEDLCPTGRERLQLRHDHRSGVVRVAYPYSSRSRMRE